MPAQHFLSFLLLVFTISSLPSCTKDNNPSNSNNSPKHPFYIHFDLDGVPQSYGATQAITHTEPKTSSISVSWDNYATESYVPDSSTSMNASLGLYFEQHPVLEADLMALVGQQLPITHPTNPHQTSATMHLYHASSYTANNLLTDLTYNDSSSNFVQIDSVQHYSTSNSGVKTFTISGRFQVVFSGANIIQTASNGKFRLLFMEYK